MIASLLTLIFHLLIYSYYGFKWAQIAGRYEKSKGLFAVTGFIITLCTHLLLELFVTSASNYFYSNFYTEPSIGLYYFKIVMYLILALLVLVSELYVFLLKRKFKILYTEINHIGQHHE